MTIPYLLSFDPGTYDWGNNHPLTFWIFSMYEGFNTHVVLGTKLPPRLLKIPGWFWFNTCFLTHIPIWLVVWNMAFMTFHILGISSSQLTNSIIFQRGRYTTNQLFWDTYDTRVLTHNHLQEKSLTVAWWEWLISRDGGSNLQEWSNTGIFNMEISTNGGSPEWMVYNWTSQSKMDDN